VTRNDPDERVSIGRMWEQLEGGEQAGGHQKRLRYRRIPNCFRVCLGAVMPQIEA
jgi:hypothetical protein